MKLLIRKENSNFSSLVVKKILNKNFQEINNYWKLLNNHISFLILDIETSSKGEIIELGYCIIEKGEIIKKVNHLIRPKFLINNFLNNISLDHLSKAKSLEEVLHSVESDLTNKVLIGHNLVRFDFPKINQAWKEVFNKDFPNSFLIDTLTLCRYLFVEHICHSNSEKGKHQGCYGLENMVRQITKQNTYKEKHRALSDAQDNFLVWQIICNKLSSSA